MSGLSRRAFMSAASGVPLLAHALLRRAAAPEGAATASGSGLRSMTEAAVPICSAERHARIDKLKALMRHRGVGALLLDTGSTLDYFTGIRWFASERTTAAILPVHGEPIVITPAFEEPSVRETLAIDADVRTWNEDQSPFARIVQGLNDRGLRAGLIAVEPAMRYFIVDGVRKASHRYRIVTGEPLVRACRMIKSAAELALMRLANEVTLAALRHVHVRVERGMAQSDLAGLMNEVTRALGGSPEFALVLLNGASAYPHGSHRPEAVGEGSVILMDCGCTVQGYQSDLTRSWVFGEPTPRQRRVWETVKHGQELVLEKATVGIPVGALDDAVRAYYQSEGWSPGFRLPGLSHRTGHGIGLDGHEPPYLVHGDATPLESGMCFSDEPGIYIPGEFGIRLEDCWYLGDSGPVTFTALARSIEQPV